MLAPAGGLTEEAGHGHVTAGCFVLRLADADDSERVTKLINGGRNGLSERVRYLAKAKAIWF